MSPELVEMIAFFARHDVVIALDEEERPHSFKQVVADELVLRGVLVQREGYWRIKAANADIVGERYTFLGVCDFCSATPVVWEVGCATYTLDSGDISVGNWMACEDCGQLVTRASHAGLLDRAVAHSKLRDKAMARELLARHLRVFWQHHTGTVTRTPTMTFGS